MFVGYMRDTDPQMTPLPVGVHSSAPTLELGADIYDQDPTAAWASGAPRGMVLCVLWPGYLTRARVSREGNGGNDPTGPTPALCRRPVHARSNVNHIVQL